MRRYETVVVLAPSLGEADVKNEIARITAILEANKATDIQCASWGRKELSYPMKRSKLGTYLCFTYVTEFPEVVSELGRLLRIAENVLKFQTHVLTEKARKFKGNPRRPSLGVDDESLSDVEY